MRSQHSQSALDVKFELRHSKFSISTVALLVAVAMVAARAAQSPVPRIFLLDGRALADNAARIRSGDVDLAPALGALRQDAQKALAAGPFSVVDKGATPPSDDKHDYMSQAPYWWPNPDTPNGLPYVRRDGERNPEINRISDHQTLNGMESAVHTLALAYYFDRDERYAAKAAVLLRAWFLDPATRMNPNLEFGQGIPGITNGRGIGLIETRGLTQVVDGIGLLADSTALTEADRAGLKDWFRRFLTWMRESRNGRDESAAKNNHGTYYDLQVASFALFLGDDRLASRVLEEARTKRIALQIEPDGRQPLEIARTRSWSYSVGNLDGLTLLATIAERVGVDLWSYRTADGRGIRRAIEYLAPFACGRADWPHQQLGGVTRQALFPVLRRAAGHYPDREFRALVSCVPAFAAADRTRLTTRHQS